MEKLKMQTADMAERNIEMLGQMFPNCLTETINADGKLVRAIDFDKLRQELACEVVEGAEERYQFTWPDKRAAIRLANAPTNKTLRPCREESVDFDNTENLYIEGDNLEVLKLLRENYLGKVKMIYIDPPYNTGSDSFVYDDDFTMTESEYSSIANSRDEDGNLLYDIRTNNEANGRFHTDWLNMIYPRIKIAKDILSDEGVIFLSIDDREVDSLKKICGEIFGYENFLGCVGRITKKANNQGDYWAPNFDYILTYAKNKTKCPAFYGGFNDKSYNLVETDGPRKGERYQLVRLYMTSLDPMRGCSNQRYYIECPDGSFIIPPGNTFPSEHKDAAFVAPKDGHDKIWRWSYTSYLEKKDSIVIKQGKSSNVVGVDGAPTLWNAFTKTYLNDVKAKLTATPNSFIEDHINQIASRELNELDIPFDFAKPSTLISYLAQVCQTSNNDIIVDFFSGSATTAHAVMQLNAEDGGNRRFIMVQLPELTDEKSEAYKAGYKNICEIGKERIRRAGRKIKEDNVSKEGIERLDVGFRVLKLDESNMADVYYTPADTPIQTTLAFDALVDNIREGRTAEDLLFQVLPECNLPLSSKIEIREIHGKKVFVVEDGYLMACFDKDINEAVITAIAKEKPYYFVMCDRSIATDNVADNFDQIFNAYSKETVRRIL